MSHLASLIRSFVIQGRRSSWVVCCLILILLSGLLLPDRRVAGQSECRLECTATVATTAAINMPVQFAATAGASGCATSPSYEWDFGDGTQTSVQQNTSHAYMAPGSYTWKLTTSAGLGASSTIDTIAGGYGENAPARQAPLAVPVAVTRDPQNRGLYVADLAGGLLRFINTTDAPVVVGGRTIGAGRVRLLGGESGANVFLDVWDVPASDILYEIRGMAASPDGNLLYMTDDANTRLWAYNASAAVQSYGNRTLKPGNVGTIALLTTADFGGVAVHPTTGEIYFAQAIAGGNRVSKVNPNGTVTAVVGNGAATRPTDPFPQGPVTALNVPLLQPRDIVFDGGGNLYIADSGHNRVTRIEANGQAALAIQFQTDQNNPNAYPAGLAVVGSNVYVANGNSQVIVRIGGAGTVIAGKLGTGCDYSASSCGDGGPGTNASFSMAGSSASPALLGLDADANGLYVLDQGTFQKGRVRYLNLGGAPATIAGLQVAAGNIDTVAGNGLTEPYDGSLAIGGTLNSPSGVALDSNNNLFIADTLGSRLRFVNRGSNVVTLFPNTQAQQVVEPGAIVTINKDVGVSAIDNVPANRAGFDSLQGLTVTNQGVFIADSKIGPAAGNRRTGLIRFINTGTASVTFYPNSTSPIVVPPGNVSTIAGGGQNPAAIGNGEFARNAKFLAPSDLAVNRLNGDLYIADVGNKAVRKINASNGIVSSLNLPAAQYTGLDFDSINRLHIVNLDSGQVLRETAPNAGTFQAMNAVSAGAIRDVAVETNGSVVVTETADLGANANNRILRITAAGAIEPLAGSIFGFDGDGGPALNAKLAITPDGINIATIGAATVIPRTVGIVAGPSGEILFADTRNDRVRRIGPGAVTCVKTGTITVSGDNPLPILSKLVPTVAVVGGREFVLTVTGAGFVTGSKLRWNGDERQTNYISSTLLTALIPTSDLGKAGTATIVVYNPPPGGGASSPLTVTIAPPNPTPALSALVPVQAAIGTGFSLTINGNGFTPASVVQWNGNARPTTYVGTTQLRAEISAADVLAVGNAEISVINPEPGGGLSNRITFRITSTNPIPVASRMFPPAIIAGRGETTVQIFGGNFAASSRARFNGQDRATTMVDTTVLNVQLPSTDTAEPGLAAITVFTPTPGGGVTGSLPLPIGRQASSVPAASYIGSTLAKESIAALFGADLATGVASATTQPLPTSLLGTSVTVIDPEGKEVPAPLFFVSPGQINFSVPAAVQIGAAYLVVKSNDKVVGVTQIAIAPVLPGLFGANADGLGIAAGVALRVTSAGQQTYEAIANYNDAQKRFVHAPIDLGPASDQVYLILYGSGFRNRTDLSGVTVRIGGADVPLLFAGAAPGFIGLDQLNLGPIPRSLLGRGIVEILFTVDNRLANVVQVAIK
ncbi:MAG: IPT/TIG domain-containing protein [Blastocatellia bacterium]|nr:IPT/TIG domain-containing protein [Blastocatellia bacterium]